MSNASVALEWFMIALRPCQRRWCRKRGHWVVNVLPVVVKRCRQVPRRRKSKGELRKKAKTLELHRLAVAPAVALSIDIAAKVTDKTTHTPMMKMKLKTYLE